MHVFVAGMPTIADAPVPHAPAGTDAYRQLQALLGLSRCVIVQPSLYGFDNRATLDGVAALGSSARAVLVIPPRTTESELRRLHDAGGRGVRINLIQGGALTIGDAETLAPRLAELGWHLQFHVTAAMLEEFGPRLAALPCPVVLDHMARLVAPERDRTGWQAMRALLRTGRCWVKLSAPYLGSHGGPPDYADAGAAARLLAAEAPERMLWASDWPHATESSKPDTAALLDLSCDWLPDATARHAVLVSNPARLYGFEVSPSLPSPRQESRS